eukprot:PhM_4_TR14311/c0_g1_i1/m.102966
MSGGDSTIPFSATIMREALKDVNEPIPAYLRIQVRQMTYRTVADSEKTIRYLLKALQSPSANVKWKALELLTYLCIEGHPSARDLVQVQGHNPIRGCASYEGVLDEIHGDHFNERVRESASRCMNILTDALSSNIWRQRTYSGGATTTTTTMMAPPRYPTSSSEFNDPDASSTSSSWVGSAVSWAAWAVGGVVEVVKPLVVSAPPVASSSAQSQAATYHDPVVLAPSDSVLAALSAPPPGTDLLAGREVPPKRWRRLARIHHANNNNTKNNIKSISDIDALYTPPQTFPEVLVWGLYHPAVMQGRAGALEPAVHSRARAMLDVVPKDKSELVVDSIMQLLRPEYGFDQNAWTLSVVSCFVVPHREARATRDEVVTRLCERDEFFALLRGHKDSVSLRVRERATEVLKHVRTSPP